MKRSLFILTAFLLLSFSFLCQLEAAQNPIDSIKVHLRYLKGKDKLTAYSNMCRLAAAGDNSNVEFRCIREFIAEAHKQKNAEQEGYARSMQTYAYFNYDLRDSLVSALPAHLEFMAKHGLWDYYYNTWNVLIELYMYKNKLQTALRESQKMYADARTRGIGYGLGVSSYCIGGIYQTMQRLPSAEKMFRQGIYYLSKEEDITLLLSVYNSLGETLDALGKYDQLRKMTVQWKNVLDSNQRKALAKGYTPSLNGRYLYCTLAQAVAELGLKNYGQVAGLLKKAELLAEGRKSIARYKLLQVQARYYEAVGQYVKAVVCNRENMKIISEAGDSVSMLTMELQYADLLLKMGKFREAALLYQQIIPKKDALRSSELTEQLDELRTLYGLDQLSLQHKITTNQLYGAIACSVLLLIIAILYFIHAKRLRQKNKMLYETLQQLQNAEVEINKVEEAIPDDRLSSEQVLYRQLCKLMVEEELFKDADLKRDSLAERLNTNRTYISDCVKTCAEGITLNEFINRYRLRYAAKLLSEDLDMPINTVGDEAGFAARSTYNRLFRDFYGMSPSEYRTISQDQK